MRYRNRAARMCVGGRQRGWSASGDPGRVRHGAGDPHESAALLPARLRPVRRSQPDQPAVRDRRPAQVLRPVPALPHRKDLLSTEYWVVGTATSTRSTPPLRSAEYRVPPSTESVLRPVPTLPHRKDLLSTEYWVVGTSTSTRSTPPLRSAEYRVLSRYRDQYPLYPTAKICWVQSTESVLRPVPALPHRKDLLSTEYWVGTATSTRSTPPQSSAEYTVPPSL